ncbi:F0F1 ATP synthase subunit delta [Rothia sp. P6271]|uniref:F0F1 ATP synthase subunit delta n=1 Tax=unclassified Rothia (in: high G+C Gram-positive bacteria) TaxID=2689056 RepID=UPI003ACF74D8
MAGVSTESLKKVEAVLTAQRAVSPDYLAKELFAVVDVLDADGGLRRALTDPSRSEQAREGIVQKVFRGKVSESALNVFVAAATARWSAERDLADALEHVAVDATAQAAEVRAGTNTLETVLDELLTFINTLNSSAQAQIALTDDRALPEAKKKLALTLAGSPATAEGQLLIERVSVAPRGMTPARLAEKFVEIIVKRQKRSVARVVSARPLTDAHIEKLRRGLSQAYGQELKLDITVDPQVIGGLKVQVGDEILDGTVQSRLNELNRSIVA